MRINIFKKCLQIHKNTNTLFSVPRKFKSDLQYTPENNFFQNTFNSISQSQKQKEVKTQFQPNAVSAEEKLGVYVLPHPIWTKEDVENVQITHFKPKNIGDRLSHYLIQSMRLGFDVMSGYKKVFPWQQKNGVLTERDWLNRMVFLETVAGVPGFVAAMHRHLRSLRRMERDYGWIHVLLEEAENERMHLLTFLKVQKPTLLFRLGVISAQFNYVLMFGALYQFFPRVCHRIVGYLEEEAVKTYTHCIEVINQENSPISHWKTKRAPQIAIDYWRLPENATMEDVIYAIRKDEEHHRDVNHDLASDYSQTKVLADTTQDQHCI
ncbi:hypothetical protein ABPG74_010901 [Tetrahymena malaccensis]